MGEWMRKHVVAIVVADLVVGLAVFVIFGYLAIGQSQLNNRTNCYFHIFDQAVSHHPPSEHTQRAEAEVCAQLPARGK